MSHDFYVIVIGGGRSAQHCAGHLADGGLRVAGVERELVGGECDYWVGSGDPSDSRSSRAGRRLDQPRGHGADRGAGSCCSCSAAARSESVRRHPAVPELLGGLAGHLDRPRGSDRRKGAPMELNHSVAVVTGEPRPRPPLRRLGSAGDQPAPARTLRTEEEERWTFHSWQRSCRRRPSITTPTRRAPPNTTGGTGTPPISTRARRGAARRRHRRLRPSTWRAWGSGEPYSRSPRILVVTATSLRGGSRSQPSRSPLS